MTAIDLTRTVAGAIPREMRDAAGLSQRVMAEKAGCSRQHLARAESSERALTRDIGRGISRAIAARTIEMRAVKRDPPHKTAGVRLPAYGVDTAPPDLFASEQHFHTLTLATAPSEVKLTDATPELTAQPSIQGAHHADHLAPPCCLPGRESRVSLPGRTRQLRSSPDRKGKGRLPTLRGR
jgi:transcriptional regulator with XRE-family HTH domain